MFAALLRLLGLVFALALIQEGEECGEFVGISGHGKSDANPTTTAAKASAIRRMMQHCVRGEGSLSRLMFIVVFGA